jgi:hypothetical protein
MTNDLAHWDRELDSSVTQAVAKASRLIADRLDDALAHAKNALSDTARKARDGRPTLTAIKREFGYSTAVSRLMALRDELVLLAEQTRVEQYPRSWEYWRGQIPPKYQSEETSPRRSGANKARVFMIRGKTLAQEFHTVANEVSNRLQATLVQAAARVEDDRAGRLADWAKQAKGSFGRHAKAVLGDGVMLADRMAGRHVVHEDRRDPDPTLGEE